MVWTPREREKTGTYVVEDRDERLMYMNFRGTSPFLFGTLKAAEDTAKYLNQQRYGM